jgi:glutathione S-transferase
MTSNYDHFVTCAKNCGVARYGTEVKRLCAVLDQHLIGKEFICGEQYTIADMVCLPWFQRTRLNTMQISTTGLLSLDRCGYIEATYIGVYT